MPRVALKMQLFKGFEEEYKRRHAAIWPELKTLLKERGISQYSIWLDEETLTLFACFYAEDPGLLDDLPEHDVMKKWWTHMKDIMATNEDESPVSIPLKEVFYLE